MHICVLSSAVYQVFTGTNNVNENKAFSTMRGLTTLVILCEY
jgi:hypothetical protein